MPHEAEDMLPEYDLDCSRAKPNRFARQGKVAVTLDVEVLAYLQARAVEKGRPLNDLVNDLLRRDIDLVETVK
jgi:hypothetical protein